jgi:hypothetical protein
MKCYLGARNHDVHLGQLYQGHPLAIKQCYFLLSHLLERLVSEVGDGLSRRVLIPEIVHAETRRAALKPLTLWCVQKRVQARFHGSWSNLPLGVRWYAIVCGYRNGQFIQALKCDSYDTDSPN